MQVARNCYSGFSHFKTYLFILFTLLNLTVLAQIKTEKTEITNILSAVDTFHMNKPAEKLYLHLDKPYYITGDTLWFKVYLFEANFLAASEKSGICYLEIADVQNQLVKRMMLPVVGGLSWGNIALNEKDFPGGGYTIRAYTNLMRNFNEDKIYKRELYIYSPSDNAMAVNAKAKSDKSGGIETHSPALQNKKVNNFNQTNRSQNIDLQFMPEGGNLVSGIASKIGFKAIGEDGIGVQVEGKIFNSKQQEVASFKSFHKGMGTVELTPQENESYTAKLNSPNDVVKTYPLPHVQNSGTVLRVNNPPSGDSLEVILTTTPEIQILDNSYYLIGHSRGVICFAKGIHFKNNRAIVKLSKSIFPGGITCFTFMNKAHLPLNERIIYIDHQDNLKINVNTDKIAYTPRDSVALHISVSDKEGKPVVGSFSLSVTDDAQVINDTNNFIPITTHLFLTSELKGTVEEPSFYLQTSLNSSLAIQVDSVGRALDNLLLTQGWVAYPWDQVFNPKKPEFEAEPEFMIKGKASNSFKGIPNTKVLLFSRHPFLMIDTLTDKEGRFTFKNLHLKDTANYLIQSLNRNGGSFLNTVAVDEFKPPVFSANNLQFAPLDIKSDTALIKTLVNNIDYVKEDQKRFTGIHMLGEVLVTATKTVKGSKSLNGNGNADQVLNTVDMLKLKKITLLEILMKQVKGFRIKDLNKYFIYDNSIKLVMDGNYVDTYDGLFADSMYDPVKDNLEYFTAEDIIGIEVMSSPQYNTIYNNKYLSTDELRTIGGASAKDYVWLEITTRAGRGAYMKRSPGVELFKPMAFSLPLQFYRPRYVVKDTHNTLPDLRSTIHWEPSVVTDQDGKAIISFYTSDRPTNYTVIIEGSDMLGNMGSSLKKGFIKINK